MARSRLSIVAFVFAMLFLGGTLFCIWGWRDQSAHAEDFRVRYGRNNQSSFEKNAREWRTLAIVGGALTLVTFGAGLVRRGRHARARRLEDPRC